MASCDMFAGLLRFQSDMCLDMMPTSSTVAYFSQSSSPSSSSSAQPKALGPNDPGAQDGFLIAAPGLGLRDVLLAFLRMYADDKYTVILLNTPQRDLDALRDDLVAVAAAQNQYETPVLPEMLRIITNETLPAERRTLYSAGGILAITSRILVVDMLNELMPSQIITGVLVNNAHRITETSTEAFILRLLKDGNKAAFVKAFSDSPESLTNAIWKLEKTMKILFLRKVSFWPRFRTSVSEEIDNAGELELVEVRVSLTESMKKIQSALLRCIEESLNEVKRSNTTIDHEDLTVENALFRSFSTVVRTQMDPFWHKIGAKTKQIVSDLGVLRRLLCYLHTYDSVTFYSFLDSIRAASTPGPAAALRPDFVQSPWLLMDHAETIFTVAKSRSFIKKDSATSEADGVTGEVSSNGRRRASISWLEEDEPIDGVPPNIVPVLEEQPKWRVLINIVREIEAERAEMESRGEVPGPILIMVEGDRACNQVRQILHGVELSIGDKSASGKVGVAMNPRKRKLESSPLANGAKSRKTMKDDEENIDEENQTQAQVAPSPRGASRRRQRGGISSQPTQKPSQSESQEPASSPSRQPATLSRESQITAMNAADRFSSAGIRGMMRNLLRNFFWWKGNMPQMQRNLFRKNNGSKNTSSSASGSSGRGGAVSRGGRGGSFGRGAATTAARRRVRGASTAAASSGGTGGVSRNAKKKVVGSEVGESGLLLSFEEEANEVAAYLDTGEGTDEPFDLEADGAPDLESPVKPGKEFGQRSGYESKKGGRLTAPDAPLDETEFNKYFEHIKADQTVYVRPYATSSVSGSGGINSCGDDDSRFLEIVMPRWVVMYDPDLPFIRRLEVHKARNPSKPLKIHFMIYDDSIEEQKYLIQLRREKHAFERLITEKGTMAIPIDQDGRIEVDPEEQFWENMNTRLAGGQRISAGESKLVIVDVREFRSSLPSLLHTRRLKLRPCTLEVGDYVLTPSVVVERKSLPDLISSFKSGRLYSQAEAMCLHYKTPVLLIEFAHGKAFGLRNDSSAKESEDLHAKLALLAITFPKLRIIWSSSPAATAEIFEDLKKDAPEPTMEGAMAIGVENAETVDSLYNITPSDMVRALPGVTSGNHRYVMSKVPSMRAFGEMSLKDLESLLGDEAGRLLHRFLHTDPRKKSE